MTLHADITYIELPQGTLGVATMEVPIHANQGSVINIEGNRLLVKVLPNCQSSSHRRAVQIVRKHASPTKLPDPKQTVKLGTFKRGSTEYCVFMDISKAAD